MCDSCSAFSRSWVTWHWACFQGCPGSIEAPPPLRTGTELMKAFFVVLISDVAERLQLTRNNPSRCMSACDLGKPIRKLPFLPLRQVQLLNGSEAASVVAEGLVIAQCGRVRLKVPSACNNKVKDVCSFVGAKDRYQAWCHKLSPLVFIGGFEFVRRFSFIGNSRHVYAWVVHRRSCCSTCRCC